MCSCSHRQEVHSLTLEPVHFTTRLYCSPFYFLGHGNKTQPAGTNAETAETPLKPLTTSRQSISASLSFVIVGAMFPSEYWNISDVHPTKMQSILRCWNSVRISGKTKDSFKSAQKQENLSRSNMYSNGECQSFF